MIATRSLPDKFVQWNADQGAPFGKELRLGTWRERFLPRRVYLKQKGPFVIQPNNTTRVFEYPWAFHATPLVSGYKVLEIGGGLSGFQFALDKHGCSVINVDPGEEPRGVGWPCTPDTMARLNSYFGTSIELRNATIIGANLPCASFDRAFSISVIEHLLPSEVEETMRAVHAVLKPDGYFVLTVDLFINLAPFTSQIRNRYGTNYDVKQLIEYAPFVLDQGDRSELFGFSEFSPDKVLSNIESYLLGDYPALAQCLVLHKPSRGPRHLGDL